MAKKCELCGKDASFLLGGGDFRGKTLCMGCYNKAASAKSEEELNEMGFNSIEASIKKEYEGNVFITALRMLAWIELIAIFVISMMIWSNGGSFSAGFMNILTGAIIFTVLYVLSIIAENVIAIRVKLESRDKDL